MGLVIWTLATTIYIFYLSYIALCGNLLPPSCSCFFKAVSSSSNIPEYILFSLLLVMELLAVIGWLLGISCISSVRFWGLTGSSGIRFCCCSFFAVLCVCTIGSLESIDSMVRSGFTFSNESSLTNRVSSLFCLSVCPYSSN